MAQCKQNPQDFIKNAFTPQIAVMCTPNAEKCCQKNNLDFVELLQPFSRLNNDVHFIDPSGVNICVRNLKLTFLDISWRPPQTSSARKLLNSSVTNAPESRNKIFTIGKFKLEVPASTPWYETWREIFLKVQYPSDHEFTKHFLACILVISSADPNPMHTFVQLEQSLAQMQNATPGKLPKWFSSTIFKYYVILHETFNENIEGINNIFDMVKGTYGAQNCFLLKMNSRQPHVNSEHLADPWSQFVTSESNLKDLKNESPDLESSRSSLEIGREAEESKPLRDDHPLSPINEDLSQGDAFVEENVLKTSSKPKQHGTHMSTQDIEQVKLFVYEFAKNCLIPYVEKQIGILHDLVSNKKGVSKSLFSATKRWFSPNKPGASAVTVNNLIYSLDSPELQVRRLGDLLFMFYHYAGAFQAYHLAKRDYSTDQAWLYYAGALEMAALSAFMGGEPTKKTNDYMEESITTYLNTCKMPQFATRATILSSECLKHQNMYGEAAHQLIRMTSEESDLRSALLLEQASYCFLQSKMVRKYAFHMVLAGHRFSKAAQKKHSLKCYKQAYQVYEDSQWDLALDHIHYTIGKQANNLLLFDESIESFSKLLQGESKQTAAQQAMFLKEYLTVLMNKRKVGGEVEQTNPVLPVPNFDTNSIKVLVGPTRPLSTPGKVPALGITFSNSENLKNENKWIKLEEILIQETEGSLPVIFKPMMTLYNLKQLEKNVPIAVVNEPVQVWLKLINTLQTVLHLKDIHLLWTFNNGEETISNEIFTEKNDEYVKTLVNKSVTINGNSKQDLVLTITPLVTGMITINGCCYTLTGSGSASETNFIRGKTVISLPESGNTAKDNRGKSIEINVVPLAPCLQVTFSEMNLNFLTDEVQQVTVHFQNTSMIALENIYMATSVPHLVSSCDFYQPDDKTINFNELNTVALKEKFIRKKHLIPVPLVGNVLEPGQTKSVNLWVKAPSVKGPAVIDLLIYYRNTIKNNIPRYRLVRHSWNLTVQESVSIDVSTQASHNSKSVEELALAVKITNLNKTHHSITTEVTLLNVALLSKNWTLLKDIVIPKFINLSTQESAHILLKAKRIIRKSSQYSNIYLNADKKAVKDLVGTYLAFAKNVEKSALNIFESNIENLEFKENHDGILLLQWQALVDDDNTRYTVYGQSHLPIEIIRKEADVKQLEQLISDTMVAINGKEEESAQIAQNLVSYNLVHAPVIRHNFKKENLCIVPVKLLLHSITGKNSVSVAVNTIEPRVKPILNKSNLFSTYASGHFSWLGNSKTIQVLRPLTTVPINLSIAITSSGTFDLGAHIEVSCKEFESSEPYVFQSCRIHSSLIVMSADDC